MKHLKLFFAVLLSILIFSNTVYAYDPATDVQYQQGLNGIYYIEGNEDIDFQMWAYYSDIFPKDLYDLFYQEGVRIYLTRSIPQSARNMNGVYFDGLSHAATLSYNNSTNKITNITSPVVVYVYADARADVFYHELGHALDDIAEYITGYYSPKPISNSTEWQTLYVQNASALMSIDFNAMSNVPRSASEAFAEAFRLYYLCPGTLQAYCPNVHNFVSSQIAKYNSYVPELCYDNFDHEFYANVYPDLMEAFGLDKQALWNHYITTGKAEGRIAYKILKRKR